MPRPPLFSNLAHLTHISLPQFQIFYLQVIPPLPLLDQAGLPHLMQLRIRGLCFCATLLQSQKCLTSFHSSWWLVEAVVNIAINGNIKFLPVERMPSSWVAKGPPGVRLMMGEPTLLRLSCHCSCLLSQAAERVEDHAGFQ